MDYKVWPCLETAAVTVSVSRAQCGKYRLAFTPKLLVYQVNWTVKDFPSLMKVLLFYISNLASRPWVLNFASFLSHDSV